MIPTLEWKNNTVVMIDQRLLPLTQEWVTCHTVQEMGQAIKTMVIRGAPAIGVAAAMGMALAALASTAQTHSALIGDLKKAADFLKSMRPTAVNLAWGVHRMLAKAEILVHESVSLAKQALVDEAIALGVQDIELNKQIGAHGGELIYSHDKILTHCNAGSLATAGFGTALGVLYAAWNQGKRFEVFADETRPFLQGARLTAWELQEHGIPTTLITDNMAGWLMKKGEITKVIVGADRIAANGDVANKIGTYSVAVLAAKHGIPFYVAAPVSTCDLATPHGDAIVIEERPADEVTHCGGIRIAPHGIQVRNPAFDVTPHELITGIITEKGLVTAPYHLNLKKIVG